MGWANAVLECVTILTTGNLMWYDCISMGPIRFFPILIMILLIFLLYNLFSSNKNKGQFNSSLDRLKQRYADGEITKDKYNEIKKDIS